MSDLTGIFGDQGQQAMAEEYSSGATVLPPGKYKVFITEAIIKPTKAGTGKYIAVSFETQTGDIVKVFLNIRNPNSDAQRIGRQELAKIATCAGIGDLKDTTQLIGMQLVIKVEVYEEEYKGNMIKKNRVKGYFPKDEKTGAAPQEESKAGENVPW